MSNDDMRKKRLVNFWMPLMLVAFVYFLWIMLIPNEPVSDSQLYHDHAKRLAQGLGYIDGKGNATAFWAPGYSFYISMFYAVFGVNYFAVVIANLLSAIVLLVGVFALSNELYNKKVARLATFFTALYPSIIMYTTILASEILFMAMAIWTAYFLKKSAFVKNYINLEMILAGFFLAMATYVRPQGAILSLASLALPTTMLKRISIMIVSTVTLFIVLQPWIFRNYEVFDQFVFVSANGGLNLWMGNHAGASGGFEDSEEFADKQGQNLAEKDKKLLNKAFTYISEHPLEYIKLSLKRVQIVFGSESIAVVWNTIGITKAFNANAIWFFKLITNGAYFTLLLAFISSVLLKTYQKILSTVDKYLLTVIVLMILPCVLILGDPRFHLPMIPFCIIFVVNAYYSIE